MEYSKLSNRHNMNSYTIKSSQKIERNVVENSSLMAYKVHPDFKNSLYLNAWIELGWEFRIEYNGQRYVSVATFTGGITKEYWLSKKEIKVLKNEIAEHEVWISKNKINL